VVTTSNVRADKRYAILDAARGVFLEVGYGAASMDSIAAEASVSKQTLYNHFGSKKELFAAIVRDGCEHFIGSALGFDPRNDSRDPRAVLMRLAQRYLDTMLSEEALALRRTIVAESRRFPELGAVFYHAGPAVAARRLADYLAEQSRRGVLKVDHPDIAAEQFFTMLRGHLQLRALLAIEPRPAKRHIQAYVDNAVNTLLKAWRGDKALRAG
jgi:TetR/AcrR family transcriptional repressor of mexJK operon